MFDPNFKFLRLKIKSSNLRAMPALMTQLITLIKQLSPASYHLYFCSGWVWESFPTNKVSVAILSRLGDFGLRLTGLKGSRNKHML